MRLAPVNSTTNPQVAAGVPWDAIIVGAGPAGGLAGLLLARAGKRVLLVERKPLPRYKVCGGCISAAGMELLASTVGTANLPTEFDNPLERFALLAGGRSLDIAYRGGAAVSRTVLDAWLVREAIAAGADFVDEVIAHVGNVDAAAREVLIESPALSAHVSLRSKVVIAADGLGHPSLRRLASFRESISPNAHLGAGCELAIEWPAIERGSVQMVVGRHGYVGVVRYDAHTINVAAALAPQLVREVGLGTTIAQTLRESNLAPPDTLAGAHWQGTALLTRRTHPPAAERLLVIGDAAGYVEPFTGEGITWALQAARDVVPLALRAGERWENSLAVEWSRYQNRLRRRQLSCRAITAAMRSPIMLALAMRAGSAFPRVAAPLVAWLGSGARAAPVLE